MCGPWASAPGLIRPPNSTWSTKPVAKWKDSEENDKLQGRALTRNNFWNTERKGTAGGGEKKAPGSYWLSLCVWRGDKIECFFSPKKDFQLRIKSQSQSCFFYLLGFTRNKWDLLGNIPRTEEKVYLPPSCRCFDFEIQCPLLGKWKNLGGEICKIRLKNGGGGLLLNIPSKNRKKKKHYTLQKAPQPCRKHSLDRWRRG